jgi:hypothetical protein
MFTPQEQALLDYLDRHFTRLIEAKEPTERSQQVLVRMLAGVLATEMGARGLSEAALARTVDPWARLLRTWTREAFQFATRRAAGRRN